MRTFSLATMRYATAPAGVQLLDNTEILQIQNQLAFFRQLVSTFRGAAAGVQKRNWKRPLWRVRRSLPYPCADLAMSHARIPTVFAALMLPLVLLYLFLAYLLAVVLTVLVIPRLLLVQKLYWYARCSLVVVLLCSSTVHKMQSVGPPCAAPTGDDACRCCPFIPHIWRAQGSLKGSCLRLAFEATYTVNVLRRLLTLPIRPHLPDFYIVGFPVSSLIMLFVVNGQ